MALRPSLRAPAAGRWRSRRLPGALRRARQRGRDVQPGRARHQPVRARWRCPEPGERTRLHAGPHDGPRCRAEARLHSPQLRAARALQPPDDRDRRRARLQHRRGGRRGPVDRALPPARARGRRRDRERGLLRRAGPERGRQLRGRGRRRRHGHHLAALRGAALQPGPHQPGPVHGRGGGARSRRGHRLRAPHRDARGLDERAVRAPDDGPRGVDPPGAHDQGARRPLRPFLDVDGRVGVTWPFATSLAHTEPISVFPIFGLTAGVETTF